MPARVLVSNSDTAIAAARRGLGRTQASAFLPDLATGALVQALAGYPLTPAPISLLYPSNRQLAPRVRVFIDWLVDVLASKLRSM